MCDKKIITKVQRELKSLEPLIWCHKNNIRKQIDQSNHNLNREPVTRRNQETYNNLVLRNAEPNEDASKNQPGKQHRRQNQKLTQAAKARSCCTPKRATRSWRMKKLKTGVTSGKTIPWRAMARKTNPPVWIPARENQKRAEIFFGHPTRDQTTRELH
jgi:hypothetical protein